jgi:Flp pilus assembly protein TadG
MRQQRGQSLVEFAVVLPVLVLIILGILYFGRYEDYSNQETQLAEQAVRWAAVNVNPGTSPTTLQTFVQKQAAPELQAGSTDVTAPAAVYLYYPTGSSNTVGNPVRACVVATVRLPFLGTTEIVVQSAEMRIEVARTGTPTPTVNWTDTPIASVPTSCPTTS